MSDKRAQSLSALAIVSVVFLASGVAVGWAIHPTPSLERTDDERAVLSHHSLPRGSVSVAQVDSNSSANLMATATESAEAEVLRAELVREREAVTLLRSQVEELERRVAAEDDADEPKKEERLEFAKKMLAGVLGVETGAIDPAEQIKIASRLQELDADTAGYFIEQYRAAGLAEENDDLRDAALMLALVSGGEQTADFISDLLQDTTIPVDDRQDLIHEIGQWGSWISMKNIPVTASLQGTIDWMQVSQNEWERAGAVTLMSGSATPESIETLKYVLRNDASAKVKAAAIRSLALLGDRGILDFLRAYEANLSAGSDAGASETVRRSLTNAIELMTHRLTR
ncbi:MAG: hypothetical protein O7H41_15250 [Planctomycetota bacterium]|nr:hypothetical protein [Planctomycetota bacterium]